VDRFAGSETQADRMRNMPKVKAKQSAIESQVASQTQNSMSKQLFLDKLKEIV